MLALFKPEICSHYKNKRGRSMKRTEEVAAVLRFTATASAWLPVRSPQPAPLNRILCRAMQVFRHADCELRRALLSGQRLAHYRTRHISSAYSASTAHSRHLTPSWLLGLSVASLRVSASGAAVWYGAQYLRLAITIVCQVLQCAVRSSGRRRRGVR